MSDYRSIFSEINSHMLQGIMMHDQLYRLFLFLRLNKFAAFHKKQYREEDDNYKALNKFYITHQNKLIAEGRFSTSDLIPIDWYEKTRYDISPADIRNCVRFSISAWVNWERSTKELYSVSFRKLLDEERVDEANFVNELLKDVSKELNKAEELQLYLDAIDYDIIEIMDMN